MREWSPPPTSDPETCCGLPKQLVNDKGRYNSRKFQNLLRTLELVRHFARKHFTFFLARLQSSRCAGEMRPVPRLDSNNHWVSHLEIPSAAHAKSLIVKCLHVRPSLGDSFSAPSRTSTAPILDKLVHINKDGRRFSLLPQLHNWQNAKNIPHESRVCRWKLLLSPPRFPV
jgi:hypothetical protein